MASFRNGFKIFGEISLKQGLGRIRSFSEDRKPGQWLPEDQWAVRHPGSTCPEPCDKPKKPKASKSWLSVCKDPEVPLECDVRHNNCPPPPVKPDGPWYSLDNLIPKKKQEKPPPLRTCKEEIRRQEMCPEEEVCENIVDKTLRIDIKPEFPEACMPKQEPCPAPVVNLSCPLPKELDIMLWCGQPSRDTSRIAAKCQSDQLPYQEFRPPKTWKPAPFSLPARADMSHQSSCCSGSVAYSEYKQVEVPKPLYTRYKSVELSDANFLLCMTDVQCREDENMSHVAIKPPTPSPVKPVSSDPKKQSCPEKRVIEVGSVKPVPIQKAPKYKFRQKPTKLIERRVFKNPCAQHKNAPLTPRNPEKSDPCEKSQDDSTTECPDATTEQENKKNPEALTCGAGTAQGNEQNKAETLPTETKSAKKESSPLTASKERDLSGHPSWMHFLNKPTTKEEDVCQKTEGASKLKDNQKTMVPTLPKETMEYTTASPSVVCEEQCCPEPKDRFVLMPKKYNIKYLRCEDPCAALDDCQSSTFEQFIEAKTVSTKKCAKSYPPMKENILYDLQRLCPNAPFDPSKLNAPCRKPPPPDCPQPNRFYRSFSTFNRVGLQDLCPVQLLKTQRRTECGDSSGKCKARPLVPKVKDCPEPPKLPDCAEITLPCCPKANIPPKCDMTKPMPPCKKKLAPRPSFSECNKDPPPCPRMTECNCWDKKIPKSRKYSDWAAVRNNSDLMTKDVEN